MRHAKTLAPVVRAVPKTRIAQATRAAVEQLERRVFLSTTSTPTPLHPTHAQLLADFNWATMNPKAESILRNFDASHSAFAESFHTYLADNGIPLPSWDAAGPVPMFQAAQSPAAAPAAASEAIALARATRRSTPHTISHPTKPPHHAAAGHVAKTAKGSGLTRLAFDNPPANPTVVSTSLSLAGLPHEELAVNFSTNVSASLASFIPAGGTIPTDVSITDAISGATITPLSYTWYGAGNGNFLANTAVFDLGAAASATQPLPQSDYRATFTGITDGANPLVGSDGVAGDPYVANFNTFAPGDANGDGTVDGNDLNTILGNFGNFATPGQPGLSGDLNDDGTVDGNDINIVLHDFGNFVPPDLHGSPVAAVEGQSVQGATLASFFNFTATTAGNYTASINWGGGHTSAGVIQARGSDGFDVIAPDYTYTATGSPTAVVTVSDGTTSYTANTPITVLPASPSNPAATAVSAGEIDLAWTNNSPDQTGVEIDRSTDGVNYSLLTTLGPTAATFHDTTAAENTGYYYQVSAVSSLGNSIPSFAGQTYTPPLAPSPPTATVVSSSEIDLSWTDRSASATGYDILESSGADYSDIATVGPGVTSYHATGLIDGANYSFEVQADGTGANSAPSSPVSKTTLQTVPIAPSNVVAAALSDTSVIVYWQNNAYNESGFNVERSQDNGSSWTTPVTIAAGTTSYMDPGLSGNTAYIYRVSATNSAGSSGWSQMQNPVTTPPLTPAVPTNVTAAADGTGEITVNWNESSSDATGYYVYTYYVDSTHNPATIGTVGQFSQLYSDTPVVGGSTRSATISVIPSYYGAASSDDQTFTQYYVTVVAINGTLNSAASPPSPWVTTQPDSSVSPPPALVNPSVSQDGPSPNDVGFSSSDPSVFDTSDGSFITGASTTDPASVGAPAAVINGILQIPGATYTLQETLSNQGGDGPPASASYTPASFTAPAVPTLNSAVADGSGNIDLTWTTSGTISQQYVLLSADGTNWTSQTISGSTGGTIDGLLPNTNYQVRFMVQNSINVFRWSSIKSVTTAPVGATVSISAIANASEAGPDGTPEAGHFLITRTSSDYSQALTVNYTVDQSVSNAATPGKEYTALSGSVTIPAGAVSAPIDAAPKEINHVEGTTYVAVALTSGSGYTASSGEATVSITNTDDGTITVGTPPLTVGASDDVPITVTNHYGRPKSGDALNVVQYDSGVLQPQAGAVTTDSSGGAELSVHGVAEGIARVAMQLKDLAGNIANAIHEVYPQQLQLQFQGQNLDGYAGQGFILNTRLLKANGKGLPGQTLVVTDDNASAIDATSGPGTAGPTSAVGITYVYFRLQNKTAAAKKVTVTVASPSDASAKQSVTFNVDPVKVKLATTSNTVSTKAGSPIQKATVTATVTDALTGLPVGANVNVFVTISNHNLQLQTHDPFVNPNAAAAQTATDAAGVETFDVEAEIAGDCDINVSIGGEPEVAASPLHMVINDQ